MMTTNESNFTVADADDVVVVEQQPNDYQPTRCTINENYM